MLRNKFLYILLFAILICAYYHPLLTNEFTSGGDGGRIFPNLQMYEQYKSLFPLWNHTLLAGGTSFLAEPERFLWLSAILDTKSAYYNISFNILILSIVAATCALMLHLFSKLKFSPAASAIGVFIIIFSDSYNGVILYGRVNPLLSIFLSYAVILLYMQYKDTGRLRYFLAASVLTGIILDLLYYYALFNLYMPMVLFAGYYLMIVKGESFFRFMKKFVFEVSLMSVIGILVLGYTIFPMLDYMLFTKVVVDSDPTPFNKLPDISKFLSIFSLKYNYRDWDSFMRIPFFFNIILIPFILFKMKRSSRKKAGIVFLAIFAVFFMLLMGKSFPFNKIIYVWQELPILGRIRSATIFYNTVSIALAMLTMIAVDHIKNVNRTVAKAFSAAAAIYIVLFITFGYSEFDLRSKNRDYNETILSLTKKISKDNSWFSVYNTGWMFTGGLDSIRKLGDFSTYTPAEYRTALEVLYNEEALTKLKAHWIYETNIKNIELNERMISLMNIKYLYLKRNTLNELIQTDWKDMSLSKRIEFYANPGWQEQLRVFPDYKKSAETEIKSAVLEYLQDENFDKIAIIDKNLSVVPEKITRERMKARIADKIVLNGYDIKVNTNKEGVLQVPSFYDKRWNVYVDNEKKELLRVNGIYMGVFVDEGVSKIEFRFEPVSFYAGVYTSLLVLLIIFFVSLSRIFKKRDKYADYFE